MKLQKECRDQGKEAVVNWLSQVDFWVVPVLPLLAKARFIFNQIFFGYRVDAFPNCARFLHLSFLIR